MDIYRYLSNQSLIAVLNILTFGPFLIANFLGDRMVPLATSKAASHLSQTSR